MEISPRHTMYRKQAVLSSACVYTILTKLASASTYSPKLRFTTQISWTTVYLVLLEITFFCFVRPLACRDIARVLSDFLAIYSRYSNNKNTRIRLGCTHLLGDICITNTNLSPIVLTFRWGVQCISQIYPNAHLLLHLCWRQPSAQGNSRQPPQH